MSPTQDVLGAPELLDLILRQVPDRDLLTSCQRVSRFWQDAITRTPVLRQRVFLDSCSTRPVSGRYVKNHLVAFRIPTLFSMLFRSRHGAWQHRHGGPSEVVPTRLASAIRDGRWIEWISGRPQWERMQVSQPPILHLRWEVTRDDREDPDLPAQLPCAVAELRFPRGLRVGELWDLVTATRGVHRVVWPTVRCGPLPSHPVSIDPVRQWRNDQSYAADHSLALVIQQSVVDEDLYLEDVPDGMEDNDENHPNRHSLYSRMSLTSVFVRHQMRVPSLSLLEPNAPGAAIPWIYNPVHSEEVRRLANLTQIPSFHTDSI
ncbi:hypothetical protein F4781DRAFT_419846 [Annulohypoxylon bovei var. microspora]|nr:hypothetical protein F4781DRAFT_419846 [Annulohypoxylon bovei var. microspora]